MTDKQDFVYLSATGKGVVTRFGSRGYIAARYVQGIGFDVDTEKVVRVPAVQYRQYLRDYKQAIDGGGIVLKTKQDYDNYQKKLADAQQKEDEAKRANDEASAGDNEPASEQSESDNESSDAAPEAVAESKKKKNKGGSK